MSPIWASGVVVLNQVYLEHINLCLSQICFGATPKLMTAQAGNVLLNIPTFPRTREDQLGVWPLL